MERFGRFRALQKHRYAARLICGVNVSRIRRTASARAESLRSICKLRLSEHKRGSGAEKSCTRKRSCPRAHRRVSCNCGTHYSQCSSAVYGSRLSLVPTDSTKLASAEGQRIGGCIFIRPPVSDTCRFVGNAYLIALRQSCSLSVRNRRQAPTKLPASDKWISDPLKISRRRVDDLSAEDCVAHFGKRCRVLLRVVSHASASDRR